jgi:hypothetical protein
MEALLALVSSTPVGDAVRRLAITHPAIVPDLTAVFEQLHALRFRFGENGTASTAGHASAGTAVASAEAAAASGPSSSGSRSALADAVGPVFVSFPDLPCILPRGRFDVSLTSEGHVVLAKKNTPGDVFARVTRSDLKTVIHVPRRDRQGHVTEHVWVLVLKHTHASAAALKKPFVVLKAQLSPAESKQHGGWPLIELTVDPSCVHAEALAADSQVGSSQHKDTQPALITRMLQALTQPVPFFQSSPDVFRTTGGDNCMKCYFGVHDGALFPLPCGLLFLNTPIVFIPAEDIREIYSGRGGSATTKCFDLVVSTAETSFEFTMLEREHHGAVASYVAFVKRHQKAGVRNSQTGEADAPATATSSSSAQRSGASPADPDDGNDDEAGNSSDFSESSFSDPDASDSDDSANGGDDGGADDDDSGGDDDDGGSGADSDKEAEDDGSSDEDWDESEIDQDEVQGLVADAVEKGELKSAAEVAEGGGSVIARRSRAVCGIPKAVPTPRTEDNHPREPVRLQHQTSGNGIAVAPSKVAPSKAPSKVKAPGIHAFFAKRAKKTSP